jgi:hypothetical protein
MRVFLSYRRGDAAGYAGRLSDALIQRLGPKSVFQDVSGITPGRDFTTEIDRALDDSDAALVVIGPGWLSAETPQGTRRLFQADDYVRLEVSRALRRDIRVIPVLVSGARLPSAADLPGDLQELAQRQDLELHDETWHRDVDGLVRSLRGQPAVPTNSRRRWLTIGSALVALLVLIAGSWWLWRRNPGGKSGSSSPPPPACAPVSPDWNHIGPIPNLTVVDMSDPNIPLGYTVKDVYWRAQNGEWRVILVTVLQNQSAKATIDIGPWWYADLEVSSHPFRVACFSSPNNSLGPNPQEDTERVGFDVTCPPTRSIVLDTGHTKLNVSPGTPDTLDAGSC